MAITRKINGQQPFQVEAHSFSVSPSTEGYTLNYSADGIDYTAYEENTPADEVLIVNGIARGQWFYLAGNNSEVSIIY